MSWVSLIISLLLFGAVGWLVTQDMPRIRTFIQEHGIWGLLLSLPIYTTLGVTMVPSEPITLLITGLYGPLVGTITASLGNLGAAMLEYYIGRRLDAATDFQRRKERLPFGLGRLPISSPLFLLFGRMIPGYGAKLIGILGGAAHVPIGLFLWTSAIQTVLGAAILSFGGWGIISLIR
jgi:uncharacterized membrane protein YdjX (TVP38/TMEM64 family)